MKKFSRLPVLLALMVLLPQYQSFAQLEQELVFSDNFDSDFILSSPNEEFEDRQDGSLSPAEYAVIDPGGWQVEVGADQAPDALIFYADNSTVYVSPNINFNAGGSFTIEFEVNPGINDESHESGDWCAVVFGSSSQNSFVNASDGMGILFRNSGDIQVFDKGAAIYGGNGGFDDGVPTDEFFKVRIEVDQAAFDGSPATVSMFINDEQANISPGESLHFDRADGFANNYITLEGAAFGGNFWEHAFDELSVKLEPGVTVTPSLVITHVGADSSDISLNLPQALIDAGDSQLTLTSSDPAIATLDGADESGQLIIDINSNSDLTQLASVLPTGPGRATINVTSSIGASVAGSVSVNVASGIGFEEITFLDSFDTDESDAWDINIELDDRQSGTLAPIAYLEGENTSSGGAGDDLTQVNSELYPGKLLVIGQGNGVSPNHNFIEGTEFSVEVEIDPGPNVGEQITDQWSAIIIGATAPNRFVNAHDGFGVLFRNDGRIEVWDGNQRVYGSTFDEALPLGPLDVKLTAKTFSFEGDPVELNLFVNGDPYPLTADGLTYVKQSGFFGNYITLSGIGEILDHTFDNLQVTSQACINFVGGDLTLKQGDDASISVKVPEQLIDSESATVRVISSNPNVISPDGATDGVLELTFSAGSDLIQEIPLDILGKGSGSFSLEGPAGICVGPNIDFSVSSAIVSNPSFEADPRPGGVGYGAVSSWPGFSGINNSGGPFQDNGAIPDRAQIAFAQGPRTITQTLQGLESGEDYRLQFFYNVRNCCGGTMGFTVLVDGLELESVSDINPVGSANPYHFRSWDFTAENDEVVLEIQSFADGDATLLVDAVTVFGIGDDHVNIANASFESSDVPPWPGYINPNGIAGWTGTGGYGVNFTGAGPFADNGANTDQDLVAFLQGQASLSQTVAGLLNGQNYNLKVDVNARSGNAPILRISAGENVIYEEQIDPVGGAEPYIAVEANFTADASTAELKFEQIAEGDNTVLLDNVRLVGEAVNIPPVSISLEDIALPAGTSDGSFVITIPELLTFDDDAEIRIISQNPAVAAPVDSEDGVLTLTFEQGGALEQTVEISALGKGNTTFVLEGPDGVSFNPSSIGVSVVTSLVRNPSFESNYNSTFPSYSPIDSWVDGDSGNQGVNEANGPFHDNGIIPDRGRVGFIQTSNSLHQDIAGLTPDQDYLLEFYYNARNWGSENIIDVTINFDDDEVDTILDVNPVGEGMPYNYAQYVVTASQANARLEFITIAQGDATLLLDAVSLTPIGEDNVALANASFEASGVVKTFPGYIQPAPIAGWMMEGSYGVNVSGEGPFANNGANPDQDLVLFLQGAGSSASQEISGLSDGESYIIEVAANGRSGNTPVIEVSVNDSVTLAQIVNPVDGANPYHTVLTGFTADSDTAVIKIAQVAEGDNTLLVDMVKVYPGVPPVGIPDLAISQGSDSVALSWDASASGVALLSAPSVNGPWTEVTLPAVEDDGKLTVSVPTSADQQFFRLELAP